MIRQRTVKDPVTVEGVGLQTGKPATVTLVSAPASSGVNFIRTDLPNKPLLNVNSLAFDGASGSLERRTVIGQGPFQIQTIEHLMAALSGLSIDNVMIELDGEELPGLDGSAAGFVDAIKKAGITEQDKERSILEITDPVWCGGKPGDGFIAVFPDDDFRVSYTLSYPGSIGTQFLSAGPDIHGDFFERQIAPARTFCMEEEAAQLLKMGLGKGANYDNTLVMGPSGPIKTALRFPDEPVRHKILDLIGDLYLLGVRIKGHVVAIKSGHRLNMELVKKIKGDRHGKYRA